MKQQHMRPMRFADRLATFTDANVCWPWPGRLNADGYGTASLDGEAMPAHRAAYIAAIGPIPAGYEIDHLCRVRHCINPAHLEAVTKRENTRRSLFPSAVNARKTHCARGHVYDEANTRITPSGYRCCRTCDIGWGRKYRATALYREARARRLARER